MRGKESSGLNLAVNVICYTFKELSLLLRIGTYILNKHFRDCSVIA